MAVTNHVNGPAGVFVGLGSSGALEELGYSVSGIDITFNYYQDPINTDVFGLCPFDMTQYPGSATIKAELISYDDSVITQVFAIGGASGAGVSCAAGTLLVAQGHSYRLLIKSQASGTGEACNNFLNAFLVPDQSFSVGSKPTIYVVTWMALPAQQVDTSTGAVLFNSVCS
jgi:hypothetical protein